VNLNRFDVHIWWANLDQPPQIVQELEETLSAAELARAKKFAFQRDRSRFVVSHGILRKIFGRYLNTDPAQLEFCHQTWGKPYLSGKFEGSGIRFNFSHAQNMGLYAFTCKREVGVDVEFIRPLPDLDRIASKYFSTNEYPDLDRIASKYFSTNEYHLLMTMPECQRVQAFFDCWTRKEAYLKALGVGLTYPTDGFDVFIAPGEAVHLLRTQGYPHEAGRWRLEAFSPAPGYAASLAVEGHDWRLSCWEYGPPLDSKIIHF
jgi:4'-phosphopantetheinyl transferase